MHFLAITLSSHDWLTLIVGALLGIVPAFGVWFFTRLYETWIASNDLPYRISGEWFSAEFDPKGEAARHERLTFTKVRVRRGLGGRFYFRVVTHLTDSSKRPATAWKASGKIFHGDTLVGTWHSTVKNTKRFGAAVLKFVDYGRAVGYWIGPAGKDYPVYGYWIMCRKEEDIRGLARTVLESSGFEFFDVAKHVLEHPPLDETKARQ
jgi:hypothetical protein